MGGIEITAEGRADWVGSLELRDAPVNGNAMRNTARVMIDLKADVLGIIEERADPSSPPSIARSSRHCTARRFVT